MDTPLFSIVTVVFNGVDSLKSTIDSVLNQSFTAFEYIIVDGGSTDGSLDIIKSYGDRVTWISEKDAGIYDAMNKGTDRAKGEWILFMNCGDRFADDSVLRVFAERSFTGNDIVFGDAVIEYPTFHANFQIQPLPEMWKRMPFCHQATFAKTSTMKSFRFDLRYRLSADFDFIYRAYLDTLKFQYFDKVVCHFNNKGGASINNMILSVKERRSIVMRQGFALRKWIYYQTLILYIQGTIVAKRILGNRLSHFVTKFLRQE